MKNVRLALLMIPMLVLGILAATTPASTEDSVAAPSPSPRFVLGFKALADQIPDVVGTPLENEHYGANGDSLQQTSNGLLAWRKADNWTAFTNGSMTWVNGPNGIQERANSDRFPWENDDRSQVQASQQSVALSPAAPAPTAQPTEAPKAPPAPTPPPAPAPMVFSNPNIYHAEPRVRDVRLPDGLPGQRRS